MMLLLKVSQWQNISFVAHGFAGGQHVCLRDGAYDRASQMHTWRQRKARAGMRVWDLHAVYVSAESSVDFQYLPTMRIWTQAPV